MACAVVRGRERSTPACWICWRSRMAWMRGSALGVVRHLRGYVGFDGRARGGAETAQRMVALEDLRFRCANEVLQPAFQAADDVQRGCVGQSAQRELAHARFAEAVAKEADAVSVEGGGKLGLRQRS